MTNEEREEREEIKRNLYKRFGYPVQYLDCPDYFGDTIDIVAAPFEAEIARLRAEIARLRAELAGHEDRIRKIMYGDE